ncbi:MAG: hypothetical protein DWB56_14870 [Candidatus Jettenia sp.]|uniref:Phage protein n=1 Tax=Candidatus Jettenia caeni TaxID=247490 RepID=I3ILR2_9BACT|nr:hypothetical protein [Candidatus Jettenia sp. AMX1]KAA0243573.1 MAG: hypothetical protein EDM70_09975 [Candidatus Brocadia sp. AMX2]MBC6930215.1 hypothetical protein [Candidatus Jettenia sp.]GAB62657.1 hypothetical protein KSU1_C1061 [Candidatus Jettenia caeni]MCQ3927089.1 hypothetical protein [Candidatus Jettenia sp.]MDL1939887.1 hypothetical protein [Candidatus Jettenia sp. AMX1]
MALENKILDLSYEAAEDLSNDQYRIVVLASGKVRRPDASTDIPLGVLQNAPAAGEAAVVRLIGVSKIQLGETVAENEWVKLEYVSAADAGKGMDADGALDLAIGRCLVGGAEDELGEVLLSGAVHQVNAAS